jgi:hypothetical protein
MTGRLHLPLGLTGMGRRHGIFECSVCRAQLRAKPSKTAKKHHDRLTTFAPKDHIGRWVYTPQKDEFVHLHQLGGKVHVFRADFVEDFEFEGDGGGPDTEDEGSA